MRDMPCDETSDTWGRTWGRENLQKIDVWEKDNRPIGFSKHRCEIRTSLRYRRIDAGSFRRFPPEVKSTAYPLYHRTGVRAVRGRPLTRRPRIFRPEDENPAGGGGLTNVSRGASPTHSLMISAKSPKYPKSGMPG